MTIATLKLAVFVAVVVKICMKQSLFSNHFFFPYFEVLYKFGSQLSSLCIINFTATAQSFLQVSLFLELRRLVLSAQHLNEDVVTLIGDLKLLQSFIIYQVGSNHSFQSYLFSLF